MHFPTSRSAQIKNFQKKLTLKFNFTLENMWASSSKQFLKSHWALVYIWLFGKNQWLIGYQNSLIVIARQPKCHRFYALVYAPLATYLCISLQMHVPACWKNLTFPRGGRYDIHNLNYNPYNHTEVTWPGDIWTITAKTLHLISWLRWLDFFFSIAQFSFKSKVIGDFKRMEHMSKKLFPEYDELYHFFQPLWSVNPNPNQQKYHISVIF